MSTTWTRISREEASSNRLYGVGGWLTLFVTLLVIETAASFWSVLSALRQQDVPLREFLMDGDAWAVFPKLVLGTLLVTTMVILGVLFSRAPLFRPLALTALVARGPLFAAAYLYTIRGADGWLSLGLLLAIWLVECLIWVTYLQRSQRVRVTYENSVRARVGDEETEHLRYVGDGIATPLKRKDDEAPLRRGTGPVDETGSGGRAEPSVFTDDADVDALDDVPPLPPSLRRRPENEAPSSATAAAAPVSTAVLLPAPTPAPTSALAALDTPTEGLAPWARATALQPDPANGFPNLPDNAWEAALDEFDGPQRRRGLWSRVFAQARGDEKRAQADYLLIRAREISQDPDFIASASRPLI